MKKRTDKMAAGLVALLAIAGMCTVQNATADAVFAFTDGCGIDNVGIGGSMTDNGITITTLDVIGTDGTKATDSVDNRMNVYSTLGLGVNTKASNAWGTNESQSFNPVEAWVFSIDKDVTSIVFDVSSQGDGSVFTLSSSAFANQVFGDDTTVSGISVPANTQMTLTMSTTGTDELLRLTSMTVIPEPASLGLIAVGAGLALVVRRFRV